MSKVLFNPTGDELRHFYGGREYVVAPFKESGYKQKVEDATANFLMTKLGRRGLMTLEYGDEGEPEEKKRLEGIRLNKEFKKRQVIMHNRLNEERQHKRLPFSMPTNEVAQYARDLAMELIAPYDTKDLERADAAKVKDERDEFAQLIQKQAEQIQKLMDIVNAQNAGKPVEMEGSISRDGFVRIQQELGYKMMTKLEFEPWVAENRDLIPKQPIEIQADIEKKWGNLFEKPYPIGT